MKLTFPHIVAYIVGPLGFIAGLKPALVLALLGPAVAPYAVPTIALAGALLAFLHDIGAIPSTPPSQTITSIAKMVPLIAMFTYLVTGLTVLTGCAAATKFLASPAGQADVADAVDAAVIGAELAGVPAADINRISLLALAADQGVGATVSTASVVINRELAKLNLSDADRTSIGVLQSKLDKALQAALDKNPAIADAQTFIADMLQEAVTVTGGNTVLVSGSGT